LSVFTSSDIGINTINQGGWSVTMRRFIKCLHHIGIWLSTRLQRPLCQCNRPREGLVNGCIEWHARVWRARTRKRECVTRPMVQIRRHRRRRIYCDVQKADDRGFAWFILVALSPALARILSFCCNFFTTRRVQTCTSRGPRLRSNYNNIIIYYIMRVEYVRACKKLRSTKRFKRGGKARFFARRRRWQRHRQRSLSANETIDRLPFTSRFAARLW